MIFESEEVHIVSDDGTVEAMGVEWTEARVLVERVCDWLIVRMLMLGFAGVIVTGVAWAMGGTYIAQWGGLLTVGVLGLAVWSMWECVHMEGKRHQMMFYADGRVTTSREGTWNTRLNDIASIEYEQVTQKKKEEDLPYTHGVRVITRRGRVIHVAKNLEPDDAAGLAVMLSEAREAMRYMPVVSQSVQQHPGMVW